MTRGYFIFKIIYVMVFQRYCSARVCVNCRFADWLKHFLVAKFVKHIGNVESGKSGFTLIFRIKNSLSVLCFSTYSAGVCMCECVLPGSKNVVNDLADV